MGEQGWLIDPAQLALADSLSSEYRWPESTVYQEIGNFELLRTRETTRALGLAREGRLGAFFLTQMLLFAGSLILVVDQRSNALSAGLCFAGLFLVFSLGKSFRALSQFMAQKLFTASRSVLSLRLDLGSLALHAGDASLASGINYFYLLASWASLLALVWGGATVAMVPVATALPLNAFIAFLLLIELSPFRQSALTEVLRVTFIYLDQRPSGKASTELTILAMQRAAAVLWALGLVGFLLSFAGRLFLLAGQLLHVSPPVPLVFALLFTLSLVIAMLALVDDLWSGAFPSSDLKALRRTFRRRRGFRDQLAQTAEEADRRAVQELPLFRQLGSIGRGAMLERENLRLRNIARGELICREGETDRDLFVLLAGRVSVAKNKAGRKKLVTTLESGAVFGEAAFFLGHARTADVRALEDCRLISIAHDARLQDLEPERSASLQLRIWFLQALMANELFRNLPAEAFDALLFTGERVEFKPGEKIISEGEEGHDCFFIVQGEARVVQNFRELRRLKSGDAFGEITLLRPGMLRTASITAESQMIAVRVESGKFRHLLCSHLSLAVEIEKLAGERLRADQARTKS